MLVVSVHDAVPVKVGRLAVEVVEEPVPWLIGSLILLAMRAVPVKAGVPWLMGSLILLAMRDVATTVRIRMCASEAWSCMNARAQSLTSADVLPAPSLWSSPAAFCDIAALPDSGRCPSACSSSDWNKGAASCLAYISGYRWSTPGVPLGKKRTIQAHLRAGQRRSALSPPATPPETDTPVSSVPRTG